MKNLKKLIEILDKDTNKIFNQEGDRLRGSRIASTVCNDFSYIVYLLSLQKKSYIDPYLEGVVSESIFYILFV